MTTPPGRRRFLAAIVLVWLASPTPAGAWGPHTEITQAAQIVVPEKDRIAKYLAADWERLARDYVWMGDWREAVRPDHYADDYLLFPAASEHFSHMPPDVRRTYEPFFRRALQAIRTETPQNAARWVGSLLHFVQDSGSPPHAAGITGSLHAKMERWVDELKIAIPGYRPRLLGKTDDEALKALLERTAGLEEFAKVRGEKLKTLLADVKERENQPLELECADETARVTADVLHTLFALALAEPEKPGAVLCGRIDAPSPAGYAHVPVKVLLAGASYSTTANADGRFRLQNLPPSRHAVWVMATGYQAERIVVDLTAGKETVVDRKLKPDAVAGNLVRNPTFAVDWVRPGQPDGWFRDTVRRGRWSSALVRVPTGSKCVVTIEFQPGKTAPVAIRWRADPSQAQAGREKLLDPKSIDMRGRLVATVSPDAALKPFEAGFLFLEVLIETDKPLADVCRHVSVVFDR